jgi:hypothetical protein
MAKLPADFVVDSLSHVRGGQPSRLGGIRGGTKGVRAHMRDGGSLPDSSSGGHRCGSAHLTSRGAVDEATADLFRNAKLTAGKGA